MDVIVNEIFKSVVANEFLIKKCVGAFDQGFDYVYVTNEKGQFLGQAVTRDAIRKYFEHGTDCLVNVQAIEIDDVDWQKRSNEIVDYFSQFKTKYQFMAITYHDRIVATVHTEHKAGNTGISLDNYWKKCAVLIDIREFSIENNIDEYFISSIEHPALLQFYQKFLPFVEIRTLGTEDVMNILNDKNKLLVYGADIYPEGNKMSFEQMRNALKQKWDERMFQTIQVYDTEIPLLPEKCSWTKKMIEVFDRGHNSIYRIDEEGRMIGIQQRASFSAAARQFFMETCKIDREYRFIEYETNKDETVIKKEAGEIIWENITCGEVPVLDNDRKVIKTAPPCHAISIL